MNTERKVSLSRNFKLHANPKDRLTKQVGKTVGNVVGKTFGKTFGKTVRKTV
jgi:hypothetical protein